MYRQNLQEEIKVEVTSTSNAIEIKAKTSFFRRLFNFLTNPFRYLLKGEISY